MMYIGFKVVHGYNHGGDCNLPMVMTSSNRKIRRWKKNANRKNKQSFLSYEWKCIHTETLKGLDITPLIIDYDRSLID